jgi:putative PIN family toxin of toxin-antitoxin system
MSERVVYDTNIWISGLLWRGKPYQCLLLARAGVVRLVHCQAMVAELSQKLRHGFGFSENRIGSVLYELRSMSDPVEITGDLHVVTDDPDDDKFVECALAAGASLIVSGDRHLLDINEYKGVRVLSAA